MSASLFDSQLYGKLVTAGPVARLFSDTAELRAMLIALGALAQVQGAAGLIPEISAKAIHRAAMEIQIDPGALAAATAENGVPVPALVAGFRSLMQAPEHAQYIHFGATSQDIMDTALMLRLRQVLAHYDTGLTRILSTLATLAETHADTPMAARTYGQHATPTCFGAVVAGWGWPLLALRDEIPGLRAGLCVSLSGAAGTASVLGQDPAGLRAALAAALDLGDPGHSWHTDRSFLTRLGAWIARLGSATGKIGEDLVALAASDTREVVLGATGASSTMPQKQNPVAPSVLVMLEGHASSLCHSLQSSSIHRHQRDGAAWFAEWMVLPPLCLSAGAMLECAGPLLEGVRPDAGRMRATLDAANGALSAEALSFALARHMPRPDAQAAIKALARETAETGTNLVVAATERHPEIDGTRFAPAAMLGTAPAEARAFARAARSTI